MSTEHWRETTGGGMSETPLRYPLWDRTTTEEGGPKGELNESIDDP